MEKVLLICASPRKGDTAQVLSECARVIEDNGLETETVYLRGKKSNHALHVGNVLKSKGATSMMD